MSEGPTNDLQTLWTLAQVGEPCAREAIAKKIRLLAYNFTSRPPSDKEDIAQEVVASVLRSLPTLPLPRNFDSFLRYRTLSVLQKLQKSRVTYSPDGPILLDGSPSPLESLVSEDCASLLRECILELQQPFRRCLHLRYWGSFSIAEIAEHEGVSRTAIYLRLQAAFQRLELKLRQRGLS